MVGLLLLAGAVVNVAVAWVLVGAPDSWTRDRTEVEIADPDRLPALSRKVGAAATWPVAHTAEEQRRPGMTFIDAFYSDGRTRSWHGFRVDAGWPARSLTWRGIKARFPDLRHDHRYTPALVYPSELRPAPLWFDERYLRNRLPLTPIPVGFAINTLFYTAILALPLSFFPTRRRRRARRGRCPKCGYDRTGLNDPAAPCPECGVTPRT